MAIIGNLAVLVTARTSKFQKKMKSSRKTIKRFARAAALAAVAVAAATSAMVVQQLKSIDALTKTARKLGLTVDALRGLRLAAELAGVSTEKLDLGLQRMVRRIAEASTGTGEAIKALKELGLSAKELSKLSADEQFKRVAEAMSKVTNQADKLRLGFKLFDSEGVALINTMTNGRAALDEATDAIEKMGLSLSSVDTTVIENTNNAWVRFKTITSAAAQTLTVALAPAIASLIQMMTSSEGRVRALGNTVKVIADSIITVVGFIGNAFQVLQIGVVAAVSIILDIVAVLMMGLAKLGIISQETSDDMTRFARSLDQVTDDLATAKRFSDTLNESMAEQKRLAEAAADATDASAKAYEGMTKAMEEAAAAQKELNKLQRDAQRVFNQTRTPLEQYQKQMDLLNKLLEKGLINQDTFNRAMKQAQDILDKSAGDSKSPATAPRTRDFEQVVLSRIAVGGVAASGKNTQVGILKEMKEWLKKIKEGQDAKAKEPLLLRWA